MVAPKPSPPKSREGCVLLVEHEPYARNTIRLALAQAGHKVLETGDGQEAVEVMRSGDRSRMVTAILVDIGLPRNSGVEAIAFFRLQYPSIPVVVLTGQRDCDLAITLMKMGVRDYVVKPVVKQDLLRVLAGAVQGDHTARSQCVA